jgi:hypothetical protein
MAGPLLSYYTDKTAPTLSMTNADSTFPAANGTDLDPATVLKATTTSTVITLTHSGSVTAVGFAIINHNLVGATVTLANGGGYSQAITIPARSSDGQCVNAWRDMRADANTAATVWTLTITGASANVAIGELVMVTALRRVTWLTIVGGTEASFRWHWPKRIHRTFYGSRLVYDTGVRMRAASGESLTEADRALFLALAQSAKGASYGFLFIPDSSVNDAWFVVIPDMSEIVSGFQSATISRVQFAIEEVSSGLPL